MKNLQELNEKRAAVGLGPMKPSPPLKEFRLGQRVKVKHVNFADPAGWEGWKYQGKKGVIERMDITDCGASAKDPMYFVRFSKKKMDGFWGEELEAA